MLPFDSALSLLSPALRPAYAVLSPADRGAAEEFRLRAGRPPAVVLPSGERTLIGPAVTGEMLAGTLSLCAGGAVYAVEDQIARGFLALPGGHRLGICGRAVMQGGQMTGIRELSSLCLRVAHDVPGAAKGLIPRVLDGELPRSTLILSPPGRGKTTLLRDLCRGLSRAGVRISVADERGELAGTWQGLPAFDLGPCTDVLTGCPKAEAVGRLVRAMSPRAVAVDEITDPEDLRAIREAAFCGAAILATVHVWSGEDLARRPLLRELWESGLFSLRVEILPDRTLRVTEC